MPRTVKVPGFGIPLEGVPDDMTDEEAIKSAIQFAFPVLQSTEPRREALESQLPLGETLGEGEVGMGFAPGVGETAARFQASTANLISEKANVIKERIPGSQIEIVADPLTEQPSILVKLPDQDNFVEFDSPDFMTFGDAVEAIGPFMSLPTLGALALGIATKDVRGIAGILARPTGAAVGAGVGELAQSELQRLLGGELESPEVARGQAVGTGISAGLAGTVAEPLGMVTRAGARMAATGEVLSDVSERARALGMTGLTIGEGHPLLGALLGQASRTSAPTRAWTLDRLHNDAAVIERRANELFPTGFEGATIDQLTKVTREWERQLTDAIDAPLRMDSLTSGRNAAIGIWKFVGAREALATKLENDARRAALAPGLAKDIVKFDLSDVQRVGVDLKHGIRARMLHGAERGVEALPERPAQVTQRINLIPTPVLRLINDIERSNPSVELFYTRGGGPGKPQDPYSQMIEWRSRAYGFKNDPATERYGTPLYNAIVKAMENPVSGNAEFRTLLRQANKARASTEAVLDDALGRELLRAAEGNPEKFGRNLITPEQPDRVRRAKAMLQSAGGPEMWDSARGGYFNTLLQRPSEIVETLNTWQRNSPRALRQLMSEQEEKAFRQYGTAWATSNLTSVQRLIAEEGRLGTEAINIILRGSPDRLAGLVNEVGGKDTPLGRALRAGIWKSIFDEATVLEEGRIAMRPKKVTSLIQDLKASGRLEAVMTPREIKDLDDIAKYVSYLPDEAGLAEGLQQHTLASGAASAPLSPRQIRSSLTIYRNSLLGRVMINDKARSILIGRGGQRARGFLRKGNDIYKVIQAAAPAYWTAAQDWEKDAISLFGEHPSPPTVNPELEAENQRLTEQYLGPARIGPLQP